MPGQDQQNSATSFRSLDADKVVATIAALQRRIEERFAHGGLARVCAELLVLARENSARARRIAGPNIPLRVGIYGLLAVGAAGLIWIAWQLSRSLPTEGGPFSSRSWRRSRPPPTSLSWSAPRRSS